jgi:hypothetical protein
VECSIIQLSYEKKVTNPDLRKQYYWFLLLEQDSAIIVQEFVNTVAFHSPADIKVETMNVVEKSKFRAEDGTISLKDRVTATIDYGLSWYGMMQSQELVTQRLGRVLGDQHYLLRNIIVPGIEDGQPLMVLVSPQGVRLLMAYPNRGVFRAKDEHWLRFDTRGRKFKSTQPNLQAVGLDLLKKIQQLLEIQGHENFDSEAVLIFTHPRTLVDSARPITRVVSADAIEYFAANVEQTEPTINPDRVHTIVDALLYPQIPEPELAAQLLAEIDEVQTVPSFDISESLSEPEEMVQDETIDRLESFFQGEAGAEPYTPEEPFIQPEPEIEYTPAFYPDSLEAYDQELTQEYEEPASYTEQDERFSLPDDSLTRPDESFGLTQDPYASPDPFSQTDSFTPKFQEKPKPKRPRISLRQWILLGILAVINFAILLYLAYIVLQDFGFF